MPNELTEIDVHLISLVDKAANKKKLIWKSDSNIPVLQGIAKYTNGSELNRIIEFKKTDDEKRIIYGVVYSPDEEDSHGDFAKADEIEKSAHNFLKKSKTNSVDTNHNLEIAEGCTIVESAIIKGMHEYLPGEKNGTWYVAIKIDNEEIWKGIKAGEYTGLSMYGFAKRIEDKSEDGIAKKIFKGIGNAFMKMGGEDPELESQDKLIKDFETIYSKMQLRTVVDALCSAVWEVMYNDMLSLEEKQSTAIQVLEDAQAKLASIELAKAEILKAGKTISAGNMKKLQAAFDALNSLIEAAGTETEKRKILKSKNITLMENTITKEKHDEELKKKEDEITKLKEELNKSKGTKQPDATAANTDDDATTVKKSATVIPWLS